MGDRAPLQEHLRKSIIEKNKLLGIKSPDERNQDKLQKINERLNRKQKDIELYRQYYVLYRLVDFDTFLKLTGYNKSRSNLIQRFKKLL